MERANGEVSRVLHIFAAPGVDGGAVLLAEQVVHLSPVQVFGDMHLTHPGVGRWREVAELLHSHGYRVLRNHWDVHPGGAVDRGGTRLGFIAVGSVRALRLATQLYSPAPLGPGRWRLLNGLLRRAV